MPAYYTYFISSLPLLHWGTDAPFSFERFLQLCQEYIPKEDLDILKEVNITGEYNYQAKQPTLSRWIGFDTALRNELVKIRAGRKHLEPSKYLRQDKYVNSSVIYLALSAYRNPSIMEAEMILGQQRWRLLDELEAGHYFDLDFLIVYALKLLILERWERIRRADKAGILEDILSKKQ